MDLPGQVNCETCRIRSCAVEVLDQQELDFLKTNCAGAEYGRNERIFQQGSLTSNIAYVKTGLVKIHKNGPSKDQILKLVKPPRFIGIPTVLGDKINHYSATALLPTTVCFIFTSTFKTLIMRNGRFANEVINSICQDELSFYDRSINQMQKQIHGRLADALLFLADEIFEADSFELPLSQSDFGDYIHATRESVSRTLGRLKADGLIQVKGKKINLIEKDMLRKISKLG
ncbi:MAG: Crp/Fnr family transcriptional regulator [Bacteroidales bacterium]|jgi:CRP/FNR family transcriptional regulator|nr:Crp/Fnr family transcriptional regulator [Bacteroidales bacterium]HOI31960.1 Crp/Fnr family transcriptional regulator [Bacteroidales bacterium]